ncbi:conserved hypothetical protein [Leishmania major strain Friedlin]|uniref:Nudix hydrolase domain-containing protein n=1 Tax=Leishmania major TaxID=5664 RepID=Q4QIR0_LEIMA|nr:conserved hypothetical protein [Leishmania major strain Friedlin]CAG9568968.1 NUDIX_family_hydrolase_-_putative [Leishmania major strain Friedlin]CAJ06993.1 conserved hypothetical protein [Leishmania major strain Friedlin]|eukprot:XP_001680938.1 conserved hypothetical protein [Leishmania major strain Friedlin]
MPSGIPGVDLALLTQVTRHLSERRLHVYHPGSRRSAAALVLRFGDDTQRTLTEAWSTFRAATARHGYADPDVTEAEALGAASSPYGSGRSSSRFFSADASATTAAAAAAASIARDSAEGGWTRPLEFVEYLAHHRRHHRCADFVDAGAASSLQLLFLKQTNREVRRWSGQIVFPGGRRDPDDHDDFDTVCRTTYEEIGFPLQHHREFLCLGRLPDYQLHSRIVGSRGFVQARFVFLHVGDITPTVQLASHTVESVRWVPLRALTAAHVERGRVVHPLQSFVSPQDANTRLMVGELFPNTYLSFPSLLLPGTLAPSSSSATAGGTEAGGKGCSEDGGRPRTREDTSSASPGSPSWRVWGLTLRTANELLSLDSCEAFDWPFVESNSRLLQYGVFFPMYGYYELLYQFYWWRAWMTATMRLRTCEGCAAGRGETNAGDEQHPSSTLGSSRSGSRSSAPVSHLSRERQRWRRVLYGSSMERRYAVLPASAGALLRAAPATPIAEHVVGFAAALGFVVCALYTVAAVIASVGAAVGAALGVKADLHGEARRRAYYDANTPSSVVRHRRPAAGACAELWSLENATAHGDTVISAADAVAPSRETSDSCSCWPRQLRGSRVPCWRATADEAALSAELRSTAEVLHGESLIHIDSAVPQDTRRRLSTSTEMPAVKQHLTGKASAAMRPTPSDAGAVLEPLTVRPSRVTTTTDHLTTSSAISTISVDTIRECGSAEDAYEAGKELGGVGPVFTGVAVPAEHPVAAAMPADAAELRHEEELKVIMCRYRPQSTEN